MTPRMNSEPITDAELDTVVGAGFGEVARQALIGASNVVVPRGYDMVKKHGSTVGDAVWKWAISPPKVIE